MVARSHQDLTLRGTQDGDLGTLWHRKHLQAARGSITGAGFMATKFEPIALFSVDWDKVEAQRLRFCSMISIDLSSDMA